MLLVNGIDLRELVRRHEVEGKHREGFLSLAGEYVGLPVKQVIAPSRYLLGENVYNDDDGTVLLVCSACGDDWCWPLVARIAVNETTVRWFQVSQSQADDDEPFAPYDGFGPFLFDRAQYEDALANPTRSEVIKVPRPFD